MIMGGACFRVPVVNFNNSTFETTVENFNSSSKHEIAVSKYYSSVISGNYQEIILNMHYFILFSAYTSFNNKLIKRKQMFEDYNSLKVYCTVRNKTLHNYKYEYYVCMHL